MRRNDVDLDTFAFFIGLDGDFAVNVLAMFGDVDLKLLLGVDLDIALGENKSSNWRLADINGSYLSDKPLKTCEKSKHLHQFCFYFALNLIKC